MTAQIRAASLASILCACSFAALAQNKACALATPAELEAALGSKATMAPGTMGAVEICNGTAGAANVLIRLLKRAGDPPKTTEHPGVEAVKRMGATVETKTYGPIFCMVVTPSAQMASYGFTTTCTVSKHPMYAVIEVKTQKQATPIDKLHPIAEKMSSRF
jgi:hypothetical protein